MWFTCALLTATATARPFAIRHSVALPHERVAPSALASAHGRPVLVAGAPGSGTTWLMNALRDSGLFASVTGSHAGFFDHNDSRRSDAFVVVVVLTRRAADGYAAYARRRVAYPAWPRLDDVGEYERRQRALARAWHADVLVDYDELVASPLRATGDVALRAAFERWGPATRRSLAPTGSVAQRVSEA